MVANIIDLTAQQLDNISMALRKLKDNCDNLIEHQQVWAENLHVFPNNYIPPIRVPKNFSVNDLKPHILQELDKST